MGPRSPLRFGRCRTDVPRTSCNPSSARLRLLWGRSTMVQGLASGSVGSWHEVPRTSLGLRSAPVVAEQTAPGRLATHLPRGYGCGRAGAHGSKVSASVVTEQTSTGRLATHLPQGYGCCGAGALY